MTSAQDCLRFQSLCVPNVHIRVHIDLTSGHEALLRMLGQARNFHLMSLVEALLILCRVVEDREARGEVDDRFLTQLMHDIILRLQTGEKRGWIPQPLHVQIAMGALATHDSTVVLFEELRQNLVHSCILLSFQIQYRS